MLDAIENGRADGNGNMPVGVFEGADAEAVAEFVAVASGGSLEVARAFTPLSPELRLAGRLRFRRSVRKDVVRVGASAGLELGDR